MTEQTAPSRKGRLKQIVQVFLKYKVVQNISKQQHPEMVRQAFEELGPTFIKIGQMLSVRNDLLSSTFVDEFKQLQDNVKSDPFPKVKALLEAELLLMRFQSPQLPSDKPIEQTCSAAKK